MRAKVWVMFGSDRALERLNRGDDFVRLWPTQGDETPHPVTVIPMEPDWPRIGETWAWTLGGQVEIVGAVAQDLSVRVREGDGDCFTAFLSELTRIPEAKTNEELVETVREGIAAIERHNGNRDAVIATLDALAQIAERLEEVG